MKIGVLTSIGVTLDAFFPELVDEWERAGHAVSLAAGTASDSRNSVVLSGLTRQPSLSNIRGMRSIHQWILREDLDVVLTNTATASALVRLRRTKVPVVYFCHGLHWDATASLADSIWQFIEARLLRNTAGVLTINSDDERWFEPRLSPQAVKNLPGGVGVPLAAFPRMPAPAGLPLRLLWAGEFSDRKRPEEMIRIASQLQKRGVDFHLVMLGEGEKHAQITAELHNSGLQGLVELPGRMPVQPWIAESHVMVHTAKWEGLPRVLLEGYAMGRRAIAFDVKGVRDIPRSILIPSGDTEAFTDAVERFLAEYPQVTHDDLLERYSIENAAREIRSFLESFV